MKILIVDKRKNVRTLKEDAVFTIFTDK